MEKVVIITGTSSGFGKLTAARLASCGHRVYATMRNIAKSQDLLDELKERGAGAEILVMDVNDPVSVHAAVEEVVDREGRIDVLFNNAGFGIGGFFEDLSEAEIREQMETNFFGVQRVTREVLPVMRRQRSGLIVNMSSISGLYALPGFGAYNASKWALEGFSESLYYELKPFNIRVCCIEPGSYRTQIFLGNRRHASRFFDETSPYYKRSQYMNNQVENRMQNDRKDPEDIARLVEKLIDAKDPPLRSIPDRQSKILYSLRRFLPAKFFQRKFYALLYRQMRDR